ncbi:hypothetical protein [Streptomyces sp. MBT33]|uniref:hypothetical protein n=1 Tax=Streptomyces sp. MBT33 TaxID=1488363 RepID=UPI00190D54BE|nr:hypothetical protein [Streptomyces sp. MBT33]MBK3640456.1 hypothetical protein [Streptomyces sp. MBT33]
MERSFRAPLFGRRSGFGLVLLLSEHHGQQGLAELAKVWRLSPDTLDGEATFGPLGLCSS